MGRGTVRIHAECGGQLYQTFFQSVNNGKVSHVRMDGIFGCEKCKKPVKMTQADLQ